MKTGKRGIRFGRVAEGQEVRLRRGPKLRSSAVVSAFDWFAEARPGIC
jgi:hypothetical protein